MDTTIIQIPVSKTLKNSATTVAKEQGFSSLQDFLRLILTKLSHHDLVVQIEQPAVKLSKRNDERYARILKGIRSGKIKTKTFNNTDDIMNYLNS